MEASLRTQLHEACVQNNLAVVKNLLEKHGCDPSYKDGDGDTPLHVAAFTGSLDILMYLIEERKCSPGCPGQWGRSPLHNACQKNGNLTMVKYLVEKHGCDPSCTDDDGDTPLHMAAFSGSLDILVYLIEERKCSPGCPGQWGRSLLHNACEKDENEAMVRYLVEKCGCDPSRKDDDGHTPLDVAAFSGNLGILMYLIEESKFSLRCPGQWGRSLLRNACQKNGNLAVVKYLVEKHGCDPSEKDEQRNTPLHVAAFSGSLDILMYLIEERKCSPGCPGQWGRSPLHNACEKNGNLTMVKYLVEKHGCDPSCKDGDGDTPLHVAAFSGSLDILMYLIEDRKCSPECSGQFSRTLLHNACGKNGNLAMVKYLVEKHGCDPSCKDGDGHTPLHVAAFSGSLDILIYLIEERKCSPECPGQWGRSPLRNACQKNGNLAMVKYLVEKHDCDPSCKDGDGDTPLHVAAFSGSLDVLMYLIEERKCSPECPGQWGRSPLHNACEKNRNLAMVKYLLEKHGCDISGKDGDGHTPLHVAAFSGSLDILIYLIEERKCSPGCPDQLGRSLLHNACQVNGNLAMVKYLIEKHGCDPSEKDEQRNTPLHVAAFSGSLDILMFLIEERKCSPGCPGQWGRSPLHNACQKIGNLAMVKYLIEKHGCDPSEKDEQRNTPLHVAAFSGSLDILIFLIEERKCNTGRPGQWGRSPLHNACQKNGNLAMVKYLVEKHGCDPSEKDEQRNTPLHVAAFSGCLDILMYLIEERKWSPGCRGQCGRSPLHNACENNGNLFMVKYLVENHGCDPSEKDEQRNTPLHVAAFSGSLDILMFLIEERKCSPGCPGQWGRSSLHNACQKNGNLAMVKYLVEKHGCDPSEKDEQRNTPLHVAAFSGSLEILMYLIEERKCSPECPGQWGRSPLHNACKKNGNLAMVKYLVEKHGCDPSCKDGDGHTPLHVAAFSGSLDILMYLIEERKCRPQCPGQFSRTPLHNACGKNGNLAMVKYLVEKHGCDLFIQDICGQTPLDLASTCNDKLVIHYLGNRMGVVPSTVHFGLPTGSTTVRDEETRRWIPLTEDGLQLQWDHPAVKNYLGPMLPDWCTFQKWNGDIVFVNMETATTIQEDPRAAHQRYKDALKDGYVSAKVMKILIIGAAGVGKTHLFHLLLNKPPPEVRHSTPVMEKPVQVIQTALKDNSLLENVTDQELYELLAYTVNTAARHNDRRHTASPEASINKSTLNSVDVGPSLHGSEYVNYSIIDNSHILTEVKEAKMEHSCNPPELLKVEELLVPYIAKTKDAAPILDVDWIYFIDSGGQPQFHQLLPAFIHHTNLNIFVLRLCDKLSDHPTVEYYDESGTCVSSTPSLLTNKEILQHCAQATQTVDQNGDSRLLIVGTHRDLEHQCNGETRDDKNKQLMELLIPSIKDHLIFCNENTGDVIFPLNAKSPEDIDQNVTVDLHKCIFVLKKRMKPTNIPLRWLVFHQEIKAVSSKMRTADLLDFDQCLQVATRLHMVDDTKAALKFFSDLNVILYYPVLPNVVFINPQSFLNIVTEIIERIVYNKDSKDPLFSRARNEGMISIKLIEWLKLDFPQAYKPSMFEAKDLITLLLHLGVVTKCNHEYFMPSLLKGLDTNGIEASLSLHPDTVAPCAVYNDKRWLECGTFSFLITSLLSSDRWTLTLDGVRPVCAYSNCIKMYFESILVTLVDYVSHIEIHVHGDMDDCQELCPDIKLSIFNAFKVKPQFGLVCPCGRSDRHVAKYTPVTLKRKQAFCSKNQLKKFSWNSFGATPEVWMKYMCEHSLNLGDLINDVAVISAKWRLVGVQLNLPNGTLDEIQTQNAGKPDQCILSFEQVFATWRSLGTSPYTWKTLINALRSPGVGEVTLANELNVKYCSLPDMDL